MALFVWLFYAHTKLRPSNISKTLGSEQKLAFVMEKQSHVNTSVLSQAEEDTAKQINLYFLQETET